MTALVLLCLSALSFSAAAMDFIAVDAEVPLGTNGVSDTAAFVKAFVAKGPVKRARWTVSGLGVFRAYVNGREVGADDFLKPGLTHVAKRRHSFAYDVTPFLKDGRNVLAAEVSTGWWRDAVVRNPLCPLAKESGFGGELEIEYADGSAEAIATGTDWRAAYGSGLTHAEIYWGETFDARVDAAWRTTGNVDWKPARACAAFQGVVTPVEGRTIRIRRDLTLRPREIYVWKGADGVTDDAYGRVNVLRRYRDGDAIELNPGETLVVDFGQNAAGVPEIVAEAAAGTELIGHPAEMLNDRNGERSRGNDGPAGSAYIANYRTCRTVLTYVFAGKGEETYHPSFSFFGGRYFSYSATGKVTLRSVAFLPVMSIAPEDETGTIVTGNADLNRLISNCVWGMRSNYLSVPTDCPQRNERLGWAGDTQAFCGAAVYAADVYGFLSKWMTDMRDSQFGDDAKFPGSFRRAAPIGPAGYLGYMIGWSDAGVIVPHTLWKQYGDTAVVRANWEAMTKFLALLRKTDYVTPPDEEQCADWLSAERYEKWRIGYGTGLRPDETRGDMRAYWNILGLCYYIWDLRMMAEMADAIGDAKAASAYRVDERKAVKRFRYTYLGTDGLLPARYRDMQTPAAFLLKLGLCPTPEATARTRAMLKENFLRHDCRIRTGFLGTSIIMDVLADSMDDPELAYSVLLQHGCPGWLYSVDQGATTIWERWDGYTREKGFGPVSMNSYNHYAYGAVLGWMYRTMAGIRPGAQGGYGKFVLAPKPDRRVGSCRATYRTRFGTVESDWSYDSAGAWRWRFVVPEGTSATVILPTGETRDCGPGSHEVRTGADEPPAPPPRESWAFRQELAVREPYVARWTGRAPAGTCDFSAGLCVEDAYGTGANLKTACDDLATFLRETGLAGTARTLRLVRGAVTGRESHRLEVTPSGATLTAEDDEGLRRGIYDFERRLLASESPALALGATVRKPWLETRLSRCFFGPINRPPLNHDELMDDIDYYPDAYLSRLAHEGVNALWLVVRFCDLGESSFTPRSADAPRRLTKLRRTVGKLARYGIKLYLFAIEPRRISPDEPFARAHPECVGMASWTPERIFCANSPVARQYLAEITKDIYGQVPGLGGFVGITHGERPTNCLSELWPTDPKPSVKCPRCRGLPYWRIHADCVSVMANAMRSAEPSAKFFSWFYHPQPDPWRHDFVYDCAAHVPKGVGFVYNFESGVVVEQLGRPRVGGDYWLSAVGPGEPFRRVSEATRAAGTPLMAKIQVSCAYEMTTVPYVPAPDLLLAKYRAMKAVGCTDVMQCWYIGSAPGVMTEAAGLLACNGCDVDEATFGRDLARPLWGEDAEAVAALYAAFSKAYAQYPVSNDMQYFGPFSDGVVWPMRPDLELQPLSPTYKPDWPPSGDEIGDCLENHTLDEACRISSDMLAAMRVRDASGEDLLDRLAARTSLAPAQRRELGVMKAVRLQTEAAHDIFCFYRARRTAVCSSRDGRDLARAREALNEMRALILNEQRVTRELIPLAEADSRLGYHADAEVHRYHPARLRWRLGVLARNLARVDEIGAALRRGEPYPQSATERAAVTCRAVRDERGALSFELPCGVLPDGRVSVVVFDRCGTAFSRVYASQVANGRLMLSIPPSDWGDDETLRPGWIFVRAAGSGRRFPEVPEPRLRLNLGRRQITICARVVL